MDDKSHQEEAPAAEANAADPLPPDRRSVRRKLVQSTLFSQKPPEAETIADQKGDKISGEEEVDGDEECTGSQKKRKRKGKTAPLPRTPKKKVKDKDPSNSTPKRNGTPPTKKSTPRKSAKANGLNGACGRQLLTDEASPPPIPNLRLEAKIIAEENSRLFAGKQLHPFFSSWKVGKKQKDVIDLENWRPSEKKDHKITIGPIHVFEKSQDDDVCLDWKNWTFCDVKSCSTSYDLECKFISSGFEGFVNSLNSDRLPGTSQPFGSPTFHPNKVSLGECLVQQEHFPETLPAISVLEADKQAFYPQIKDTEVDLQVGSLPADGGSVSNSYDKQHGFLQERTTSCYMGFGNHSGDSLWIDKYQPKKAAEVCGNAESVKLLSEWLHCWHERDLLSNKDLTGHVKHIIKDNDYNYYQSDTDSENRDGVGLKNVLLVTGPAGSGKSAAIYACAKEQGFKVLESNASQWRSGAVLKHEFEECLRSNMLNWSVKDSTETRKKHNMKFSPALPNGIAEQPVDNEVIEVIPIPDEEGPQDVTGTSGEFVCKESGTACSQGDTKLLLLIEDVDVILPEDRGFIASIQHIAEAAKGPIVLTSNNNSPVLPDKLERLQVCFTMPSVKELLQRLFMICALEKANIQPQLIERLIGYYHGDIRKTIMHLQFWCNGHVNGRDRGVLTTCSPLLFDLDASHQILPKIIPWGSPSQLSELVEKEITNTLSMLEENGTTVEEEKVSNTLVQNDLERHNKPLDSIEAKKEAMLDLNCYADDCNEVKARYGSTCEFPSSSGSPIAFSRRKIRRKLDVVMSSDSEDDCIGDRIPNNDTNQELFTEGHTDLPSHCPTMGNCFNPLADKQHNLEAEILENLYQIPETANRVTVVSDKDTNQELCPEVDSDYISHCPATENCFKHLADKQHDCEVEKSVNFYQISETANRFPVVPDNNTNQVLFPEVDCDVPLLCPTIENCFKHLAYKQHGSEVQKLENLCQFSEAINDIHMNKSCKSIDVSCVPESSFVPETIMENEKELLSGAVSYGNVDNFAEVSVSSELFQSLSQVEAGNLNESIPRFHENSFLLEDNCTEVAESSHEDGEDNQTEMEVFGRGYHLMDECSRVDINRSTKFLKKSRSSGLPYSVQETWKKLRGCHTNLKQHVASEKDDAVKKLKLAFGMSNLISEVDLLFSSSLSVMSGSLEPTVIPSAEFDAFSCEDEQLQMISSVAQHGFCIYAKDATAVTSKIGSETRVDLDRETLASSPNMLASGLLLERCNGTSRTSDASCDFGTGPLKDDISSESERKTSLFDAVLSMIPLKSYLSLKGNAFHEYVSSLGYISRSETSRLAESIDKTRKRRRRGSQHYLSSGRMMLCDEDISLLARCSLYGKCSPQSKDSLRS